MRMLLTLFKGFSTLKQIGLILALLLSLWATFKGIVYIHDKGVINAYVQKGKQAFNEHLNEDEKDANKISENVKSSSNTDVDNELCGGPCPDVGNVQTPMSDGVEPDSTGEGRPPASPVHESDLERWYRLIQQEPESIPQEVQSICTYNQLLNYNQNPHYCE